MHLLTNQDNSVWDAESNEELQRILFLLPSLSVTDRTVKPLTELKSLVSVAGELQQIVSSIPKHKYKEDEEKESSGKQ